ncbi:hypothetical protein [Candidatus Methylomicrobium oryzae]|uniref:hypothetical protein n=1 Tax=Candidatus Methylomicrobium oryzae TaxID=2802053 RepID=UPI0019232A15|nr:hypothetical protein [Methylomicrobium sp. RS1]
MINDLDKAQQGFIESAQTTMEYAFQMGETLNKLKKITPHGQFESLLKNETRFVFGVRYAQMLMKIAANKPLVLESSKGEAFSVREMYRLISNAKKPQEVPVSDHPFFGKAGKEEIIEGEFTEIKPEPTPPAPPPPPPEPEQSSNNEAYGGEDRVQDCINDLIEENKRLAADYAYMREIFEDDNQTARAVREIEKLQKLNRLLEGRINALTNENAELVKQVNWLGRKNKAMQKQLKGADAHE